MGLAGLAVWAGDMGDSAEAKSPGETYCFYGTCHRVKSIEETQALVGAEEIVEASFYDSCKRDPYNPCGLTSSGEVFRPDAPDNAASPIYPDGTKLLVWSPDTQVALVVRVNNAGPYWGGRKLDVSRAAAEKLGFLAQGVSAVRVRVLEAPDETEATYRRERTYEPVPGHIGRFASLEDAMLGANTAEVAMAVAAAPGGTSQSMPAPVRPEEPIVVAEAAKPAAAEAAPPAAVEAAQTAATAAAEVPAPTDAVPVRVAEVNDREEAAPAAVKARPRTVRVAVKSARVKAKRVATASSRTARRAAGSRVASTQRAKPPVRVAQAEERVPRPNDISVFSRYERYNLADQKKTQPRFARKTAAYRPRIAGRHG
jgi:rare lipoprotein A